MTKDWWESTGGDREKIEYVLNHLHLWDLFLEDDLSSEAAQVALLKLGETIRMGWVAALERQFPNRQVVVDLLEDGGYGPEVRVRTIGVGKTELPTV